MPSSASSSPVSLMMYSAYEALQIAVKRREVKSKGEKERCSQLNAEFPRMAKRGKKVFLGDECKEIEGKQQNGED